MNPKIFKGRTVEEATEEALKTLNEDLENLEIKNLRKKGQGGIYLDFERGENNEKTGKF